MRRRTRAAVDALVAAIEDATAARRQLTDELATLGDQRESRSTPAAAEVLSAELPGPASAEVGVCAGQEKFAESTPTFPPTERAL